MHLEVRFGIEQVTNYTARQHCRQGESIKGAKEYPNSKWEQQGSPNVFIRPSLVECKETGRIQTPAAGCRFAAR